LALYHPRARAYYDRLGERRTVVRIDWAGCGISDRGAVDFSLEATLDGLAAVVDRAGLGPFDIVAGGARGTATALAFAATRPACVRRMVLRSPNAGPDQSSMSWKLFRMIASEDWVLYTETLAHRMSGESLLRCREVAGCMRQCMEQVDYLAEASASFQFDATPYLPIVACPTLVVRRAQADFLAYAQVVKATSAMPRARFSTVPQTVSNPFWGDAGPLATLIEGFLDEPEELLEPHHTPGSKPHASPTADRADGLSGREIEVLRQLLTARECQILGLVAQGLTNQEIAERLVVSVRTVETHLGNVYGKIGARGRTDAVALAIRSGLAATADGGPGDAPGALGPRKP
jgi:DNA-binding CsgD family transcriptional regulator/pimeloyl-ACP methyl ester carboxylesterase